MRDKSSDSVTAQICLILDELTTELKGYQASFVNDLDGTCVAQHYKKHVEIGAVNAQITITMKVLNGIFNHQGNCEMRDIMIVSEEALIMVCVTEKRKYYFAVILIGATNTYQEIRAVIRRYAMNLERILTMDANTRILSAQIIQEILVSFKNQLGPVLFTTDIVGINGQSVAGEIGSSGFDKLYAASSGALATKVLQDVCSKLRYGRLIETITTSDKFLLISRHICNEYYWGVAVTLDADLLRIKNLMNEYFLLLLQGISRSEHDDPFNVPISEFKYINWDGKIDKSIESDTL